LSSTSVVDDVTLGLSGAVNAREIAAEGQENRDNGTNNGVIETGDRVKVRNVIGNGVDEYA